MGSPAIQLNDLCFAYSGDTFSLHIPVLQIEAGERVAFTGRSGCGKTTLVNLIAGILRPDSGSISVHGQDVSAMDDAARRKFRIQSIGFVFQEFELLEYLRGSENILLPYNINPGLKLDPSTTNRMNRLAENAGIEHLLKRYPHQMSQGERQRFAVCRALIAQPKLLIADEPTGNLDAENATLVMNSMHRECKSNGTTLITISHDEKQLSGFDRVINVSEGFSA